MREPSAEVPVPIVYVLQIYQDTFRHEKPVVVIHTAEPLSPISVGDYLYEVSFPDSLNVPRVAYFASGCKAACDFNTRKRSSDPHHEGLRKSRSHSTWALLNGMRTHRFSLD